MVLAGWFAGVCGRRQRNRMSRLRRVRKSPFANVAAEQLELRALLSNIAVTAQAGVIRLVGDTGDHTVAASVVGTNLELAGSGGTTLARTPENLISIASPCLPKPGFGVRNSNRSSNHA